MGHIMKNRRHHLSHYWLLVPLVVLSLGSDCQYPKDPKKTLENARGGTLRVGVSDAPPWAWVGEDGAKEGVEVALIRDFAGHINATIDWESGSQHELLEKLKKYELDIVIGGLTSTSPWKKSVGFTQPFVTLPDSADADKEHKHVMAVKPGENALITTLEELLKSRKTQLHTLFPEATS